MQTPSLLEDFPILISQNVIWGEMDVFQHVNNVTYFRYFENVRMALFIATEICDEKGAVVGDIGPILGETSCRFKAPLTYPDRIIIGARIDDVGEDRFNIHQVIYSTALNRIAAEGKALIVSYDYGALKKAKLPERWLHNFEKHRRQSAPKAMP